MQQKRYQAAESYVACLDVLGVKSFLQSNKAEALATIYADSIRLAKASYDTKLSFHAGSVQHDEPYFKEIEHMLIFSDSIFLVSKDAGMNSFEEICQLSNVIFKIFLSQGLPMRGGIAKGAVVIDKEIEMYVGPGIVRAAMLEGSLKCLGVVLSEQITSAPHHWKEKRLTVPRDKVCGTKELLVPNFAPKLKDEIEQRYAPEFKKLYRSAPEPLKKRYIDSIDIVSALVDQDRSLFEP